MLGFFTPNHIDAVVVNLGVIWAGGVASPANPTYTAEELAHQLKDSGAKALVTQKGFLKTARKAAEMAGVSADRIILLGDERDDEGTLVHWLDVTPKGAWITPKRPHVDPRKDLVYVVYSSVSFGARLRDVSGLHDHRARLGSPRESCSRTTTWWLTRLSLPGLTGGW